MIGISNLEYLCAEVRHIYVSYVDKESERRLVEQLSALLPGAGFIAEEGSGSLTDEDYCWVIDPLNGTSNYIHDMAPYSVSIALRNNTAITAICEGRILH